jgi:hypothetical protein
MTPETIRNTMMTIAAAPPPAPAATVDEDDDDELPSFLLPGMPLSTGGCTVKVKLQFGEMLPDVSLQ